MALERYTIEAVLNRVFNGTDLNAVYGKENILNAVYDSTAEALRINIVNGWPICDIVNITTDPQVITFPDGLELEDAVFVVIPRVYNEVTGESDGGSSIISSKTTTGFTISSPIIGANVYLEYIIKEV